jgi:hypothetical protein
MVEKAKNYGEGMKGRKKMILIGMFKRCNTLSLMFINYSRL